MQELIAKMKLSMPVTNVANQVQKNAPNPTTANSSSFASFGQPRNINLQCHQGNFLMLRNNNNNIYHPDSRPLNFGANINFPNLTNSTPI